MTSATLLALAERAEAGSASTVPFVEAMRLRIYDGCEMNVPQATACFALAASLRAIAGSMTDD